MYTQLMHPVPEDGATVRSSRWPRMPQMRPRAPRSTRSVPVLPRIACAYCLLHQPPDGRGRLAVELEAAQLRHSWIPAALVTMRFGIRVVQRLPADGAETRAVLSAERLIRKRENEGVIRPAADVEIAVGDVWAPQLVVVRQR